MCPLDRDCWGKDSDICYSDYTSDWVKEKTMKYRGRFWFATLHETCTLDWECKYISKFSPIHYDSNGVMFIVIDDNKSISTPGSKNVLLQFKNYNVYFHVILWRKQRL